MHHSIFSANQIAHFVLPWSQIQCLWHGVKTKPFILQKQWWYSRGKTWAIPREHQRSTEKPVLESVLCTFNHGCEGPSTGFSVLPWCFLGISHIYWCLRCSDKSGVTLTGSLQGLILTVSVQGQGLVHHLKAIVLVTWRKQVHTKLMYVNKTVQTTENYMKTVLNTSNSHTRYQSEAE